MALRCDIHLGFSCNNDCIHCFNRKTVGNIRESCGKLDKDTGEVRQILREAVAKGVREAVFTGGEPSIRPDFFELLGASAELGMGLTIQTNARAFCSKSFASKALAICPGLKFVVSFHSVHESIFDDITCVKGSYKQALEGIDNLRSYGASVSLKMVILNQNCCDIDKFIYFAKSKGVTDVSLTFVQGSDFSQSEWLRMVPRYRDIEPIIIKAAGISDENGLKLTFYGIPFCFLKGHEDKVSETEAYVKPYLEGNTPYRVSGGREDILKNIVLAGRRKPLSCKSCSFFNTCLGVWGEYLRFYGSSEFKPQYGIKSQGKSR